MKLLWKYGKEVSGFRTSLEKVMCEHPENWMNHYHGSDEEINLAKHYICGNQDHSKADLSISEFSELNFNLITKTFYQ